MFASYLIYQLIDLVVAVFLVRGVDRLMRRPGRALATRWPRLMGTALRRWFLLVTPVCVLGTAVVAGLAAGPLQELMVMLSRSFGLGPVSVKFLGIGVAFYTWLVLLPLGALRRSVRGDGIQAAGSGPIEKGLAALSCVLGLCIAVESVALEPNRVQVVETSIGLTDWPADAPPLRIVVIADLQSPLLTDRERSIPDLVAGLEPDLILLPGDLVGQSFDDDLPLESARYVTERLHAPRGAFAVNGDVDQFVAGGVTAAVQGTAVRYLDNQAVILPGEPRIEILGLDPSRPGEYRDTVRAAPRAPIRIAIVHRPRHAEEISHHSDIDLVVAGHTHGGQVVVPGYGPPITASPLPRKVASGGLHATQNGTALYVSRGVGLEAGFAPPIRFYCPPEISLLVLGPVEE